MYYIYRITNLINGKTYIGQHKYKKLDDSYMGSGKILKQAIKKHGIENFKKEILYSRIQYRETADDMERFAIAKERAIGKAEYNIASGGNGGSWKGRRSGMKGKHLSEESRKKMSVAKKGHKVSEKTRKKLALANTGKHLSEETRKKLSESHKKKHPTEETRMKMSDSSRGENNGFYGKKHSDDTKKKLSEIHTGRHWYNDGKISVMCFECPEGFVSGRLK